MNFGEHVNPTDAIGAILGAYPFSIGLFRELLQNSDDAGATKQVFVLNSQEYPTGTLCDPKLADTQGPALLAHNDALFSDNDWVALQTLHRSSKKADTSKIGKYGIGFRSCYHITDNPQILSGSSLAILDPHHQFKTPGGAKIDFVRDSQQYHDQLSSFDWLFPESDRAKGFSGTIIRLPLRRPSAKSSISDKVADPSEIRELLQVFINEEIGTTLLFLKHITSLEIHEINAQGTRDCLAKATITKHPESRWDVGDAVHMTYRCTVTVNAVDKTWRILQSNYTQARSTYLLSERSGCDVTPILSKHKLLPEVGIAMPLSILSSEEASGRLFTYLPLPLRTSFPGHVHGLFALTQSRQNLCNSGEIGLVPGSDDSVLVAWNHLLFDVYVPNTWAVLFPILLHDDNLTDIFRAWPPSQNTVECGDSAYWQSLPSNILVSLAEKASPVWPVVGVNDFNSSPEFSDLGSVIVASAAEEYGILRALANAGLKTIQPPEHIVKLLCKAKVDHKSLTPEITHHMLLAISTQLGHLGLTKSDNEIVMTYLLSTRELVNIIGLRLIPVISGEHVALQARDPASSINHTLLEQKDVEIFRSFDESAIGLHMLPPTVAELFLSEGSRWLNIKPLTPERVVEYLLVQPNPRGINPSQVGITDGVVEWLSDFWFWLSNWPSEGQLFPSIRHLYLLPARNGLKSLENGIFNTDIDVVLLEALEKLGVPFLHPKIPSNTRRSLDSYGIPKSVTDIRGLLKNIREDQDELDQETGQVLVSHLIAYLPTYCRHHPLSITEQRKLRRLPVFPLLLPSDRQTDGSYVTRKRGRIPESSTLKGVIDMTILPILPSIVYLDGLHIDLAILPYLQTGNHSLSRVEVLTLAFDHFPAQPKHLQRAFVNYMVQNIESLPPSLLQTLKAVQFIAVADGTLLAPADLVDPSSTLASLFSPGDIHLPSVSKEDAALIRDLGSLRLFKTKLAAEIVEERIVFISTNRASKDVYGIASQLLHLLVSLRFDCTKLNVPPEHRWLPTNKGLRSSLECYDREVHRPELCDEVLALLDRTAIIPSSLRKMLGWDKPIPLPIVIRQLALVVKSEQPYKKLRVIIRELGKRADSVEIMDELRNIISDRPWIPISRECVARTSRAIFSSVHGLSGFHQIPSSLADKEGIRDFLSRTGCTERPSSAALLSELGILQQRPPSAEINSEACIILKLLPAELTDEERLQIFVPDINFHLHPISQVYFNDIDDRVCHGQEDGLCLAHPQVGDDLAKKLGIQRLGLKFLLPENSIDMGEDLTTRIRNVLAEYTEQQIFNEFLANASDAGATDYGILIDERPAPDSKLLSRAMAPFQSCPSLIIYNNGTFTPHDFEGICSIGTGGKKGRTDTIGQFGLGALSMFHFTEMAMIVSGDQVLFLDPSKSYLPLQNRASLRLPLDKIKRYYSDHLATLDGIFDFHVSATTFYNGTLFRLPLRNSLHSDINSILNTPRTAQYLRDHIVTPYSEPARQSLIFTSMNSIKTFHRDTFGNQSEGWSLSVHRKVSRTDGVNISQTVRISGRHFPNIGDFEDNWTVVSTKMPGIELSDQFAPLVEKARLRSPVRIALAACPCPSKIKHSLFSTLPLPITTSLPVHMSASFILAPDRRHIRFDNYENLESKYNRWVLSDLAPPLYLFLLEVLLGDHGQNNDWWPGNSSIPQDSITRVLVDGFYSAHLVNAERRVCSSMFYPGRRLYPKEAIIIGEELRCVDEVILLLRSPLLVHLPSKISWASDTKLRFVDPSFVRSEVVRGANTFVSKYKAGCITPLDIQDLVRFLEDGGGSLIGLPLLPLADGTLATLERANNTKTYYSWQPVHPGSILFRRDHLLHPEFDAAELLNKGLNVSKTSTLAIQLLTQECLPDDPSEMTTDDEIWISTFWAEYQHLGVSPGEISTFPLVRTMQPGYYVSIDECKRPEVLLTNSPEPDWLCTCLDTLGAVVVRRRNLPTPLRDILEEQESFPPFQFQHVLKFFETIQSSISRRFSKLSNERHSEFAAWSRSQIILTTPELFGIARLLPIWPTFQMNQNSTLSPALGITMLPKDVPEDVALRFTRTRSVDYSLELSHLEIQPLSISEFRDRLELPKILSLADIPLYKRLMEVLVSSHASDPRDILVPNGNRVLVKSNTLYAREPLFIAAFGTAPRQFVLKEFKHLESDLRNFGLKSEVKLDHAVFKSCATAINKDTSGTNRTERATSVFKVYCEDLPLRIPAEEVDSWQQLDSLRFIPSSKIRQQGLMIHGSSDFVRPLPEIVAPNELVRPGLESIAWTQRALFQTPPNARVLNANASLGVPAVAEVIEHLRTLASIAVDYTHNPHLLVDLEATYKWLNAHQDEAQDILIQFNSEDIFLNVDDPNTDPWEWRCAEQLFFNIRDAHNLYSVRKFLTPFRDLLLVSGVEDIEHPPCPESLVSSAETQLASFRSGFNLMRQQRKLTDVVFISEDETEFPAHRSLLAHASEYFQDLFCGNFTESGPASANSPIRVLLDHSARVLEFTLEYIYMGTVPDVHTQEDLLQILDLSHYWGLVELGIRIQTIIIDEKLINPCTYQEILEHAEDVEATLVVDACKYFEEKNVNKNGFRRLRT